MPSNEHHADLPTFIGIGGMRCGTTWLHSVLQSNPDVFVSQQKELHFFHRMLLEKDLAWYREQFRVDGEPVEQAVRGEISPSYSMLSRPTLERIRELLPGIRLVLTIRNPVERCWSHFLLEASGYKRGRVDDIPTGRALRHFERRRVRARSDYPRMIRNYRAVFGKEALLIQKFDELSIDPDRFLANILEHIGADPDWKMPSASRDRVYANQPSEMPDVVRWYLADQWLASVRELDHMLEGQVGDWVETLENWSRQSAPSWRLRRQWNRWVATAPERIAYTLFETSRDFRRRKALDGMITRA